jgi:hypothetical protein
MRCLVQLGSLDFADGSTWQEAGDDLRAASSALEDDACADAVSVRF